MGNTSTPTPPSTFYLNEHPYGSHVDILLGVFYILLMAVGIPSNIVSVIHFSKQKARPRSTRDYFKVVYTSIASVDLAVCVFCFPMVTLFLSTNRDSVFFQHDMFCKFWGFLWEVLPYYSVYLVLVLSLSRALILVKPMTILSKRILVISLATYVILLILSKVAFFLGKITTMAYAKRDTMCILTFVEENATIYPVYTFFNIILLAMPIVPICIGCVLSISRMYKTGQAVRSTRKVSTNIMRRVSIKKSQARHRRATVTVIIMTVTYILCNVPVFLNYCVYGVWSAYSWSSDPPYYQNVYNTSFLYYYSWNMCLVLFVVINAAINPIIYVTRMKEFRQFVVNKCQLFRNQVREHTNWDQTDYSLS